VRPAAAFGHYRPEVLLGRGPTGEVFRAFDTRRERLVALKRLLPHLTADEEYRARFEREVGLAATLREPHIIPVHDYGEIDGRLFIDMRLVEGVDLATVLRRAPLSPARAVDVVSQLADGLDAAHAEGLVHRDVKPSNVLLVGDADRAAGRGFVYLVDLGVASALGGAAASGSAPTGPMGRYPAPECRFGGRPDRRADVYALACMLDECLSGPPGPAGTSPGRPSHRRAGPQSRLGDVVARGMAEDPGQRHASAGRFAAEARAALLSDETVSLVPARPVPRLRGHAIPLDPPARPGRTGDASAPRTGGRGPRPGRIAGITALVAAFAALALLAPSLLPDPVAEIARLRVGLTPADVVVSPDRRSAYVANLGDDTVSVVDTMSHTVVGQPIAVGDGPNTLALSGDGGRLYVSNTRSDSVTVIDTAAARAVATVDVGAFPDGIVLSPDGRRLYVGNAKSDTVSVVDTATARVVGRPIPVGRRPYGMGISPDGSTLYVSGFDSDEVVAVDTAANTVTWRTRVGDGPLNVAVARDGTRVYVVDTLAGTVTVVDAVARRALPDAIGVGRKPIGIALSADAGTLYVAERDGDSVRVIATASRAVGDPIEPGKGPVAMTIAGDRLYVVSEISGELTVLQIPGAT
jgi:serine/threonine-protein kinase